MSSKKPESLTHDEDFLLGSRGVSMTLMGSSERFRLRKKASLAPARGVAINWVVLGELPLSEEELAYVFSFLDSTKDLYSCALVSKRWYAAFKTIAGSIRRDVTGLLFYSKAEVLQIIEKEKEKQQLPSTPRQTDSTTGGVKAVNAPKLANVTQHHSFKDKTLTSPTFCEICTKFIWGIYPVAHHCTICKAHVHKKCFQDEFLTSACPFPNSRASSSQLDLSSKEFSWADANRSTELARMAYYTEQELKMQIKGIGAELVTFINEKKYDTQGFIAMDHHRMQTILAFTGTVSVKDIWTDVLMQFRQFPELKAGKTGLFGWRKKTEDTSAHEHDEIVKGSQAHLGFMRSYLSVEELLIEVLSDIKHRFPHYSLHIVGHSLGGALASLAAVDLKLKLSPPRLTVFTVGQPKVGNAEFVNLFSNLVDESWRLVNFGDPVPELPPANPLWRYKHTNTHVLYGRRAKEAGYAIAPFASSNKVSKSAEKKRWKCSKEHSALTTHTIYMGIAFPSRPQLVFNKTQKS